MDAWDVISKITGKDREYNVAALKQLGKITGMEAITNLAEAVDPTLGTVASLVDTAVDANDLRKAYSPIQLSKVLGNPYMRFLIFADLAGSSMDLVRAAHNAYTDSKMDDYRRIGNLLSDEANVDYNMRRALKEHPEWVNTKGHFSDTYKKSNHRTFSNESMYWQKALDYAHKNNLITDAAYNEMRNSSFKSWYSDKQGRTHYRPQAYQYNDPEWQNYMRTQEKDVIIDAPIEGSLQQALPIVIGDEDKVRLSTENINNIYGIKNSAVNLADFARNNPGVVSFAKGADENLSPVSNALRESGLQEAAENLGAYIGDALFNGR